MKKYKYKVTLHSNNAWISLRDESSFRQARMHSLSLSHAHAHTQSWNEISDFTNIFQG